MRHNAPTPKAAHLQALFSGGLEDGGDGGNVVRAAGVSMTLRWSRVELFETSFDDSWVSVCLVLGLFAVFARRSSASVANNKVISTIGWARVEGARRGVGLGNADLVSEISVHVLLETAGNSGALVPIMHLARVMILVIY